MNEIVVKLVAGAVSALAVWILWRIIQIGHRTALSEAAFQKLCQRHRVTYWMTYPAAIAGMIFPLGLYYHVGYLETDWRPAGLGFGLMIAIPLAVVALRTLPVGKEHHAEFWQMYLHRYKAGAAGIALLYGVLLLIGLIALICLL